MHRISLTKFKLGHLQVTHSAFESVPEAEVRSAVLRHLDADWGDVCPVLKLLNDRALARDERILSMYRSSGGTEFWIVSEWDRSSTTVLLPAEF